MIIPKPFSSKTLLSLTTNPPSSSPFLYSIFISNFSASSLAPRHSHSQSNFHSESKNVRVSVWWDFENCNLPSGVNVYRVSQAITAAVRGNGIKGPIQITAFGDVLQLSRTNQEALSSTGVNITHIPNGGKNSADRSLLIDLMCWVSQNPPPSHLFLISGDRDFANVLHRLRMNNYNILLATKDTAPSVLCSAASIMWLWDSLVKGENLSGRHFNQPPDGPYASWYGYYKGALEDPFSIVEQPICSKVEDMPRDSSEPAVRPIPKAVKKQICHILSSCPKGISITDLRIELMKSKVSVDKDFYGYKKFSRFLLSMPHILKLKDNGDGQFNVSSIAAKAPEPFHSSPCKSTPAIDNGSQPITRSSKSNSEEISVSEPVDGISLPSSPKLNLKAPPAKLQQPSPLNENVVKMHTQKFPKQMEQLQQAQPPKQIEQPSAAAEKVETVNAKVIEDHLPAVNEPVSTSEMGFFRKFWRRLFGSKDDDSMLKSHNVPVESPGDSFVEKNEYTLEECDPSGEIPQEKVEKKSVKSPTQGEVPVYPIVEPTLENETAISSELHGERPKKSPGLFNRILNWCKLQGNSSDTSNDQPTEIAEQTTSLAGKTEVFSVDYFWRDMESFIVTKKGSLLISQSSTRKQIARNLQKEGPLVLRSLNESDVLQLVDMIISEKKWVEECPSEAFPFKLTLFAAQSIVVDSPASNGLSSMFLSSPLESNLQRQPGHEGGKKIQNIFQTGVSSPVSDEKPSARSRSEILGDCQKLVEEILKEFPGGYNMGSFRKLFLERYGYELNAKKLGYPKLAFLLQIMPGVDIESNYIIPSNEMAMRSSAGRTVLNNTCPRSASSDSELSDASKKDEESDSTWEELGPADNSISGKEANESVSRMKGKGEIVKQPYPDYEYPFFDDEFSDSEEESGNLTWPGGEAKPAFKDANSSLLQMLDSWYSSNEGEFKNKPENPKNMFGSSTNGFQSFDSSTPGKKTGTSLVNYSSVADPVENKNEMVVDSILSSLKKSKNPRMV
ncbi:hypothetical protein DKX38_028987 [Salix brachista]|uniref:HTH OST-type domain-containing protein n=1 Tax=Salix brachista TaxID=2182728 RepID=A0A5N5IXZ6_9ROSI|nr:hypothetical protein DKX38_028987 [Salix brachista]